MKRGADRASHQLTTTDARGATMSGAILASDLRWLRKLLVRVVERAEPAGASDRVTLRMTTTELRRADRLANLLGWHEQHHAIDKRSRAGIRRGTSSPKPS